MSYPKDFLETRAVIKHGAYAVLPPEGRVINVIPNFEGFETTILTSPKMGAYSVFYVSTVTPGGKTTKPYGEEGVEIFVYVMDGEGKLTVKTKETEAVLTKGGYIFVPAGQKIELQNKSGNPVRILMYKQRYKEIEGYQAETVVGNANEIQERTYADMDNVFIQDFLPTDLGFDMNMHILSFEPAGCHPFMETHVQEHGAYVTSGQGFYQLGEQWYQIKKEDFIWMGPFSVQGTYATGRERFTYIYSKDCNRDEIL